MPPYELLAPVPPGVAGGNTTSHNLGTLLLTSFRGLAGPHSSEQINDKLFRASPQAGLPFLTALFDPNPNRRRQITIVSASSYLVLLLKNLSDSLVVNSPRRTR